MRTRRRVIVLAFAAFLVLTLALGYLGLERPSAEPVAAASQGGAPVPAPTPALNGDPGPVGIRDSAPSTNPPSLLWMGAAFSAAGSLACFIVFRVEVRKEKDSLRAKRHRSDYYRDLKRYNEQLRGPPRDNT